MRITKHNLVERGRRFWRRIERRQPARPRLPLAAVWVALVVTLGAAAVFAGQAGWLASGASRYMVLPGDTIEAIAAKQGVPATLLVQVNRLRDPNQLRSGQILLVPNASGGRHASGQRGVGQAVQEHFYQVQYGDSLLGIATHFGLPVGFLQASNRLPANGTIYVGDRLLIPDQTTYDIPGKGPFIWPVSSNVVVRGYFYGHQAVDVLMPVGSPVVAAGSGEVAAAGWHAHGYGNVVVLDHGGGTKTLYAHLNEILVAEGQIVKQGELIGATGHTGYSTHPHLHFELYIEGQVVKPCLFLADGCR